MRVIYQQHGMCSYFINDGSVLKYRKKEVRIFQNWQALPQTLRPSTFLQAARLPLSKRSPPTSKNVFSEIDSFFIAFWIPSVTRMTPQKGLVAAHFQKRWKGAVASHACVFRYVCLMVVLEQRDSVLVCSTPGMLALRSLTEPPGAAPRLVLLILMIFSPFHTLWFLGGQQPQPGCF